MEKPHCAKGVVVLENYISKHIIMKFVQHLEYE
jgi:hypothetical protein